MRAGRPDDLLEANRLVPQDLAPYNHGTIEKTATITNNVGIGRGTVIHSRTTIRGLVIVGDQIKAINQTLDKKVPYVRRNYTKTTKIRTVIREEPIKLAKYIKGKAPKYRRFSATNKYRLAF